MPQGKRIEAMKITHGIRIDGNLDEADWKTAPEASGFITNSPVFGKPASQRSIVKILYDNTAIYIGAYLYDSARLIRKQLTARDVIDRQDADVFIVGFDTYHDKQNAFSFRVTAAGVQGDLKESQNGGVVSDVTWDAVWESRVSIKKDGWVAEIRIPFSAVRFPRKDIQDWGINFGRLVRRNNELSLWNPEDPSISGDVNQWGVLEGLRDIKPPVRLSLSPYLSGGIRKSPTVNGSVTEYLKSGGMDVKYGVNESFTLDMTLVPDFAQVQSDNVFLNLSPFEVKFDDYRPFFTEGTELFNKAGLFYSRRIGARPAGADAILNFAASNPNYSIEKNPGITRLYNATKFSGRTSGNLGIGILNAVGAPMYAKLRNNTTGADSSVMTEPLTNYNIIVFDKAFAHRSSLSFTNTNVLRKGDERNANVSSVDLSLFDKRNNYNFLFTGKYSDVWGKTGTSNGFNVLSSFNKVSGLYRYSAGAGMISDRYDPNDLGYLAVNNSFDFGGSVGYFKTSPTRHFLIHQYTVNFDNTYLYRPFVWTSLTIDAKAFFLFKNFWDITGEFKTQPLWYKDYFEPRTPGKLLQRAPYYYVGFDGSTDSRKKLFFKFLLGGAHSTFPGNRFWTSQAFFRYRFNDRLQLTAEMDIQQEQGNIGYSFRDINSNPVISARTIKTNTSILSAQYGFTQRMNWSVRLRHNWTLVNNTKFFNLDDDGSLAAIPFVDGKNRDINFFNIDMFYTWDFLLGSRLTLAWKNALGNNVMIDPYTDTKYLRNFSDMFSNPHSNEVTLKIVYYLDYLKLQRHL